MIRWAGIHNNRICLVSDKPLSNSDYILREVPSTLDHISSGELMTTFRIDKDGKFVAKSQRKPAKELRVAFVTNHRQKCGIATYGMNLIP